MKYKGFKRSMSVVVVLSLLLTAMPVWAADTTPDVAALSTMAVPPLIGAETVFGSAGEEVVCDVFISNNPGFSFLEVQMGFDPTVVTPVALINGDIIAGFSNLSDPNALPTDLSVVKYTWAGATNVFGGGMLFRVIFKIKENATSGTVQLPLTHSAMNQNFSEVFFQKQDGVIEVVDFIYGDVNGDRVVNVVDSMLLLQYIAGWNLNFTPQQFAAADTYKDGVINAKDIVYLMQYVAGWNVELGTIPSNAPTTPTPTDYPIPSYTPTPTPPITFMPTPTVTITPTGTPTITPTGTPMITPTGTSTPKPTITGWPVN